MDDSDTMPYQPSTDFDNVTLALNFTCPNITSNNNSCNVTIGDDEEYIYDYDTSLATSLATTLRMKPVSTSTF